MRRQDSEQLRQRIRIQFVDQHGMAEAGIDGGGLFKDFMENLVKEVSGLPSLSPHARTQRVVYASWMPITS